MLTRAVSFVGYPYVWGGTSEAPQQPFGKPTPGGFDCSGFVWRVFKLEPFPGASALASVLRGRTTYQMSGEVPPAQRIRKAENLQPGDLIFQGDGGPKSKPAQVDHAGIYLGGGWFVHSSGKRHHPPSVRRVVPRPVRVGPPAAARSRSRLARYFPASIAASSASVGISSSSSSVGGAWLLATLAGLGRLRLTPPRLTARRLRPLRRRLRGARHFAASAAGSHWTNRPWKLPETPAGSSAR